MSRRFPLVFFAASLAAVALGFVITGRITNLAAWGVGVAAALAMSRSSMRMWRAIVWLAPLLLLASLFHPGPSGVHRWIQILHVNWNVAFLVLPAACAGLAALARRERWMWIAALATAVLLVIQPDASQATAFAAAMLVVVHGSGLGIASRAAGTVFTLLAVAIAWMRPDPLLPVPEVEGVIRLAWSMSPLVAIAALAALTAVSLSPLLAMGRGARTAALALCAHLTVSSAMPLAGAYPVPLVGVGTSPVLGFWLGAGVLAAAIQRSSTTGSSDT